MPAVPRDVHHGKLGFLGRVEASGRDLAQQTLARARSVHAIDLEERGGRRCIRLFAPGNNRTSEALRKNGGDHLLAPRTKPFDGQIVDMQGMFQILQTLKLPFLCEPGCEFSAYPWNSAEQRLRRQISPQPFQL